MHTDRVCSYIALLTAIRLQTLHLSNGTFCSASEKHS